MDKRSQAALEFLTTYAWAFLVIIIMITSLAYFGVLKPSKILPSRCNFGTELRCIDYAITYGTGSDGTFKLRLKNSVGEPITVTAFTVSTESPTAYSCSTAPATFTWSTDEAKDLTWSGCNSQAVGFIKGDKGKVFVTIDYYLTKTSATYTRQVSGEVFTTVT